MNQNSGKTTLPLGTRMTTFGRRPGPPRSAGGAALFEMMGKEVLARVFRERDWVEIDDVILMEERTVGKEWNWMETRWILLRNQERKEFKLFLWLYSAREICQLLEDVGFGSVDVYGSLEAVPYDQKAVRLVAVARK